MVAHIYFGRPGSLQSLPQPKGGAVGTRARDRQVFQLGSGGTHVSTLVGGKRKWTYEWQSLDIETFAVVQAFDQGHNGTGPFALVDPGQVNYLTVNQSAASSESYDTDNFTVYGSGGTLDSDPDSYDRGPRSLGWNFAAPASGAVVLDSANSQIWPGIPVVTGQALCFSFYAKGAGADPIITLAAQLWWYNVAGQVLSATIGSSAATNSSTWTQYIATATPPVGAAYVSPRVTATAASVTGGARANLDRFQLQAGTTPTVWRPGTGVVPVEVTSHTDAWQWGFPEDARERPTLVLQEVGP